MVNKSSNVNNKVLNVNKDFRVELKGLLHRKDRDKTGGGSSGELSAFVLWSNLHLSVACFQMTRFISC